MSSPPPGDHASTRRVALYARVAARAQVEPGQINDQLERLRAFAGEHSLTVANEYADDAVSGNVPLRRRPAAAQFLADARRGTFSRVLMASADRLGRSATVLNAAERRLQEAGVQIDLTRGLALDMAGLTWPV